MNKYQKALTNLHNRAMENDHVRNGQIIRQTKALQKLVDKNTSKKVVYKNVDKRRGYLFYCPSCDIRVPLTRDGINQYQYQYCPYCGQKLNWSEYDSDWEDTDWSENND